jgi:hypothetical protein
MVAPALSQSKLLTLDKCDAAAANQVFGYLPTNTSSIVGTVSHASTDRRNTDAFCTFHSMQEHAHGHAPMSGPNTPDEAL